MSSKMNSNALQLLAFLSWNVLVNGTKRLLHGFSMRFRWVATREGYEIQLENLTPLHRFRSAISHDFGGLASGIFELIIVIFIVAALIGNVANATTGITIAHTGFTPNANLTASPGAVPLTQLFPLLFIAVGIMGAFEYFKHRTG